MSKYFILIMMLFYFSLFINAYQLQHKIFEENENLQIIIDEIRNILTPEQYSFLVLNLENVLK